MRTVGSLWCSLQSARSEGRALRELLSERREADGTVIAPPALCLDFPAFLFSFLLVLLHFLFVICFYFPPCSFFASLTSQSVCCASVASLANVSGHFGKGLEAAATAFSLLRSASSHSPA